MRTSSALLMAAGIAGGAVAVASAAAALKSWGAVARRARKIAASASLDGQVVLITGGSRGLGLQLAREFAAHGCRIAICARNAAQLEAARADLERRGAAVLAIRCDLTERAQVEQLVGRVTEHFGRIDILVNNAGSIAVGPMESVRVEDFEQAMAIMFWAPVYASLAVIPQMRARRSGRIVNITSIGGKISVPHLVPYSCAKFAAVALSEGMRTELARDGISVTTIVPGLMRTGSHLNAEFKGDHSREYLWFSLSAASPLTAISAERAARDIVQAARWGLSERMLGVPANIAARLHGAFPELMLPALSIVNQLLPRGSDLSVSKGKDAEREINSRLLRLLNSLGRSAARELNETPA